MKKLLMLALLAACPVILNSQTMSRTYLINQAYLNIPVSSQQDRQLVHFLSGSDTLTSSVIRIADQDPDYWVFKDVSPWMGEELTLTFSADVAGIDGIFLGNSFPGQDSLYRESKRPQYHFSPRRGWNNDPNGLVWHDGEYHLFFQHNPFEIHWQNMHWGHAVSTDLIHWTELNEALYPDALGTMFSGSAVIDRNNTSGWGKDAMVAIYTAAGKQQVQCLAWSTDNGRSFTKYPGNPVLGPTRDPKVFWYEPGQHWVMALYHRAGVNLYTSPNLKDWTEQDYVKGFYECPELFELPIDNNPANTLWVLYGGSGSYLLGSFDGKDFIPLMGKYRNTWGAHYAAQTFNDTPDGRRIQIGWGRIESTGMPFNQMMCFPTELTLRTTPEGVRLFSEPIEELNSLHKKEHHLGDLDTDQINQELAGINHDLLRVVARLESLDGAQIGISYQGHKYMTMDSDELNRVQTPFADPERMIFDVEILIDRTSVEIFYQNGRKVFVEALKEPQKPEGLVIHGNKDQIKIHSMSVYELESIWLSGHEH